MTGNYIFPSPLEYENFVLDLGDVPKYLTKISARKYFFLIKYPHSL